MIPRDEREFTVNIVAITVLQLSLFIRLYLSVSQMLKVTNCVFDYSYIHNMRYGNFYKKIVSFAIQRVTV